MQEDHLRADSTTDDDGTHSTLGGGGDPNPNVDFQVDRLGDMSSTEHSSPAVQELVQYLSKQSASMSRDIESALTSTDESDEDSFRSPGANTSGDRAAESATLVASARSKVASDPKSDLRKLNEKVKLLLQDRKMQKEALDAQKAELATLRAALQDKSNTSFEAAVHQSEVNELKRDLAAARQTISVLRNESQDKTDLIVKLEHRIEGLVAENNRQMNTIDSQNAKIAKLTDASFSFSATPADRAARKKDTGLLEENTFETEFAALDAALVQIDSPSSNRRAGGNSDVVVSDLRAKLAQREDEVASLTNTVKRLEALAFDQASRTSQSSEDGARASQLKYLQETSDERARTIQLQKSTIGSLKEEVELLTRQLNEHLSDNQVNVDKQKKVSAALRQEQQRIADESHKLERDKQAFAAHLKEFKGMRREVLGGALVTTGGGVSKTRYRQLRHKRDKYKRKDYRKGIDCNAMQKRLLLNVELLEVDDSQSSSENTASVSDRSDTRSQASSRSVQIVEDQSSEAGSEH